MTEAESLYLDLASRTNSVPTDMELFEYEAFEFGLGLVEKNKLPLAALYPPNYFENHAEQG